MPKLKVITQLNSRKVKHRNQFSQFSEESSSTFYTNWIKSLRTAEESKSQENLDLSGYFFIQSLIQDDLSAHESYQVVKRLFDFSVSLLLICLLSPLFIVFALGVKLSSPGPIFHRGLRVGRYGSVFCLLKFRSMRLGSTSTAHERFSGMKKLVPQGVTPFGAFIRNYKLDELPQLLNVLRGEMSLVGPRPHAIDEIILESSRTDLWNRFALLALSPGMTGLWQATQANSISGKAKRRYDWLYLRKRSFLLDLQLLVRTAGVVLVGEKRLHRKLLRRKNKKSSVPKLKLSA